MSRAAIPRFSIKQGDTRPVFLATLFSGNNVVDLTTASTAKLTLVDSAGSTTLSLAAMTILTPATNGQVSYAWQSADTATADTYQGEVKVTWGDGTIERFPNDGNFEVVVSSHLA